MADSNHAELDGLMTPPLSRRGFVMTSLISGLTVATTRVEAQAIHTDATGIEAGEVKIPAADGPMPAYRAVPNGAGPFPIVLVIEEIFGVHEYIKDICRRLAKAGYCAVAPELYARQGDLSTMTDPKIIIRDIISKTPDAQWIGDLDATAAWAASAAKGDAGRLGVMGWCRGGRDAWLYAAHRRDLKAAVAWYGPLGGDRTAIQPRTAGDVAAEIHAPLLALYGGADTGIPPASAEEARDKARQAGRSVELVIYPDAPHGFHADYRPSYRKDAAEDGWTRALAFLKANGVG
ncbi:MULTISPECIES: dienelactone hydrolase family protein [unclassified Methylobacterium]|uniref:dienelactone hydrolase family protein n=1 Tax=unclassified Methylobacterium TaxID=2615210 RepID=UPI0011C1E80F|nr:MULTISPECIES: dienelactone hydrolase family protein [unclassified Methylobacterium]QEE39981.1 dienelactone hydrolase family protein [Methylobacterium sp. WL1]TXN58660.1 dienelactone hydrolase family protein [Methylobacterium sp. WL2]